MPSPLAQILTALRARTIEDVNRWSSNVVDALAPMVRWGTTRIWGYNVPQPVSANNTQALTWDQTRQAFVYADVAGGGGATGGPTGSSTVVPVITYVNGLLTVVGTANIAFPASNVPNGTRAGQAIFWNGSAWTLIQTPDNIELPPNSAGAIDCEFNETNAQTLPVKINLDTGVAYGTVHPVPFTTVTAGNCVFDLDSDPGILIIQNAADSAARGFWEDISTLVDPANNHEVIFYTQVLYGTLPFLGSSGDQTVQFFATDGASKTNFVQSEITTDNTGRVLWTLRTQAGVVGGTQVLLASANLMLHAPIYLCFHSVWQSGTTVNWHAYARFGRSRWTWNSNGPLVSTVAMTRLYVRTVNNTGSAATPQGLGFIRNTIGSALPQGA